MAPGLLIAPATGPCDAGLHGGDVCSPAPPGQQPAAQLVRIDITAAILIKLFEQLPIHLELLARELGREHLEGTSAALVGVAAHELECPTEH